MGVEVSNIFAHLMEGYLLSEQVLETASSIGVPLSISSKGKVAVSGPSAVQKCSTVVFEKKSARPIQRKGPHCVLKKFRLPSWLLHLALYRSFLVLL